jgi:hypothetical protein
MTMTHRLTTTVTACFLGLGAALAGCVIESGGDSSLTVYNDSDFVIQELYLVEVNSPTWGPDLLGSDVLLPGEAIELGLDCDTYDALVVDETGLECEILGIDLCFDDAQWVLTNNTCDVFSIAARQRAGEPAATSSAAGDDLAAAAH